MAEALRSPAACQAWIMISPNSKLVIGGIVGVVPDGMERRFRSGHGGLEQLPVAIALGQKINEILHLADPLRRERLQLVDDLFNRGWLRLFLRLGLPPVAVGLAVQATDHLLGLVLDDHSLQQGLDDPLLLGRHVRDRLELKPQRLIGPPFLRSEDR